MDSVIKLAADILSAYVANNQIPAVEIPGLLASIHGSLSGVGKRHARATAAWTRTSPAVPISASVTPNYIVCLEDGLRFKSMKRHLRAAFDMSPEQYRRKWQLPADYPMVCSSYARERSELAKKSALGSSRWRSRSETSE